MTETVTINVEEVKVGYTLVIASEEFEVSAVEYTDEDVFIRLYIKDRQTPLDFHRGVKVGCLASAVEF